MNPFVFVVINFLILFAGLAVVLKKTLGAKFRKEREELESRIKSAAREFETMRRALDDAEEKHRALNDQISDMKFLSARDAQQEIKRMESDAEQFISRLTSDAELKMKAEISAMRASLESDLLNQSLAAAKQVLERDLKSEDYRWTDGMLSTDSSSHGAVGGKKNYAT